MNDIKRYAEYFISFIKFFYTLYVLLHDYVIKYKKFEKSARKNTEV